MGSQCLGRSRPQTEPLVENHEHDEAYALESLDTSQSAYRISPSGEDHNHTPRTVQEMKNKERTADQSS